MTIRDYVICISQVTCFELRNWPRAWSLPLAFLLPLFPILAPTSIFSSILAPTPTPPPSFFLRAAASLFVPFHSSKPEECSSGFLLNVKEKQQTCPYFCFYLHRLRWQLELPPPEEAIIQCHFMHRAYLGCTFSPVKNEAASLLFLLLPSRDLKQEIIPVKK